MFTKSKETLSSAFKEKMVPTKNRGPKKQRYMKAPGDIGKKVSYCVPYTP